jgi:hypothetical protein
MQEDALVSVYRTYLFFAHPGLYFALHVMLELVFGVKCGPPHSTHHLPDTIGSHRFTIAATRAVICNKPLI